MNGLAKTMLTAALTLALAGGLVGAARAEAPASGPKARCKEVKAALATGKTPEQVASELGIRVKRVKTCASERRAAKAAARTKQGAAAAAKETTKQGAESAGAGGAPAPAK